MYQMCGGPVPLQAKSTSPRNTSNVNVAYPGFDYTFIASIITLK